MKLSEPTSHYMIDAESFDYFAPLSGPEHDSAKRIRQGIIHAAGFSKDQYILDLGSGCGWLVEEIQNKSGFLVSVDLGLMNIKKIKQRFGHHLNCVCADAARLPFKPSVFDRIIISEVLEHVNDPEEIVKKLAGCLSIQGKLIVSTPYREILKTYLCIHCNRPTPANAHIQVFDEQRHLRIFLDAGLSAIEYSRVQNKFFIISRLSFLFRFLPYRLWRILDGLCMFVVRKAYTIIVTGKKI